MPGDDEELAAMQLMAASAELVDLSDQELAFYDAGAKLLYHQAYNELCEVVTGRKPSDEPPDEETFVQQLIDFLEDNRDTLYQKICVEFKYCARVKNAQKGWVRLPTLIALAALLLDTLGAGGAVIR